MAGRAHPDAPATLSIADAYRALNAGVTLRGGMGASGASADRLAAAESDVADAEGLRAVYTIKARGAETLDTPVFRAGESGGEEAVPLFTDRAKAIAYLQAAGWLRSHEPAELAPQTLAAWLTEARDGGVGLVVVNPNREAHLRGVPQYVLRLRGRPELNGEALFREAHELEDVRLRAHRSGGGEAG